MSYKMDQAPVLDRVLDDIREQPKGYHFSRLHSHCVPSNFPDAWPSLTEEQQKQKIDELRKMYRSQMHTYLKEETDRCHIGIWISKEVTEVYVRYLKHYAIPEINLAAPGIRLEIKEDEDKDKCKIHIFHTSEDKEHKSKCEEKDDKSKSEDKGHKSKPEDAYTVGSIHPAHNNLAKIFLGDYASKSEDRQSWYEYTCVHELLHALGLEHTQQRFDGTVHVIFPEANDDSKDQAEGEENSKDQAEADDKSKDQAKADDGLKAQVEPVGKYLDVVRFDPYSIMLYYNSIIVNKDDPAWRVNRTVDPSDPKQFYHIRPNLHMSELDKVTLNILFPPCKHSDYNPQWNSKTKMYYCYRKVMGSHNAPLSIKNETQYCGIGNTGPNCPACRTLKHEGVESFPNVEEKWQGWSGMVYCWKFCGVQCENHDGFCGPDYGPACPECTALLN